MTTPTITLPHGIDCEFLTLPELLRARAASHGARTASTVDGAALSYAELDAKSDALAAGLQRAGVAKGERVATLLYNCREQLLLWFACAKLGAVQAPMNVGLVADDLRYTLANVDAKLFVTDAEGIAKFEPLRAHFAGLEVFVVGGAQPGARSFAELEAPGVAWQMPALDPGDPLCIVYTGGTTGMPKGALLPHFYFIASAYRWAWMLKLTPADSHFSVLQLFHIGALTNAVAAPLLVGMPSTLDRWFSLSSYWRRVRETGATILDPMGSMFTLLTREPPSTLDRAHKARAAWAATAMLPADVAPEFSRRFGIELIPCFGGTEVGGSIVVGMPSGSPDVGRANGKPWGWCELRIVDAWDQPLPAGELGQIAMRPTVPFSMMLGYHHNAERTVECWRNGWFHTGDLGYLDDAGLLHFVGRQAHWLRRRSENISAQEVESAISGCPGVREVVVVGVPSELGEDEVKAFVVATDPAQPPAPQAIVDWCAARIATFKVPRFIEFIENLPRSAAKQEIERHKLKAMPNGSAWDRTPGGERRASKGSA